MVARSSAKKTLPMPGKEYDVRLALLMAWPVEPDCQAEQDLLELVGDPDPALASRSPRGQDVVGVHLGHALVHEGRGRGRIDASFSGTRVTLWPSRPPALLAMAAQAVAPSSSSAPSWANGPDVAGISKMVMESSRSSPPPPPPGLHPAATPATRSALAAALPRTRSRRKRDGTRPDRHWASRKNERAYAEPGNRPSKPPLASVRTVCQYDPFFYAPYTRKSRLTSIIREKELDARCIPNA